MIIQHTIKINAPQAKVWEITTDVLQWPTWNPTVTAVKKNNEKPINLGSVVRIKQPGQPESEWEITQFVPNESFAWKSQRFGLTFKALHRIEPYETHSTSTLRLEATGFLSILLYPLLKLAITKALSDENNGLKLRCEQKMF